MNRRLSVACLVSAFLGGAAGTCIVPKLGTGATQDEPVETLRAKSLVIVDKDGKTVARIAAEGLELTSGKSAVKLSPVQGMTFVDQENRTRVILALDKANGDPSISFYTADPQLLWRAPSK